MAAIHQCTKCGSAHIIPDAQVQSRSAVPGTVSVVVNRKPDAVIFKGEELAEVLARVCADCGYVEMYVRGAMALYRAHKESTTNSD